MWILSLHSCLAIKARLSLLCHRFAVILFAVCFFCVRFTHEYDISMQSLTMSFWRLNIYFIVTHVNAHLFGFLMPVEFGCFFRRKDILQLIATENQWKCHKKDIFLIVHFNI